VEVTDALRIIAEQQTKQTKILEEILLALKQSPSSETAVAYQLLLGGKLAMKKGSLLSVSKPGKFGQSPTVQPISDSSTGQAIAVVGIDAAGAYGASLAAGATIAITVANGTNGVAATFVPDASPQAVTFTDASGAVHTNCPSLISGKIVPATPLDVNDPFVVTYAITLAGGVAGDTGSATCEIVPGTETSEVLVFPTAG